MTDIKAAIITALIMPAVIALLVWSVAYINFKR